MILVVPARRYPSPGDERAASTVVMDLAFAGTRVSLPRQHTDASVDAAAMIAVGDVASGSRPFECRQA